MRDGRDIIKMRWFCVRKRRQGWSGNKIAAHLQIPRRTAYYWISKYGSCNKEEMVNRPNKVVMELDNRTRKFVLKLREKYDWGPCRIEKYIRKVEPKRVRPISHNLIYQTLVEEGVNRPIDFTRKTWGKRRFERMHSNSLWQADFKLMPNDNWMLTFLDDHSRFIPGLVGFEDNPTTEHALKLFMRCGRRYGFPEQVLTDQGTQFYCADKEGKEYGESTFTQTLKELGVQHIVASKRRPTTIGKVEAFHKAFEYEGVKFAHDLTKFVRHWNYRRPHQGIGYLFPAEVYFRDFPR